MPLISRLNSIWEDVDYPFLIHGDDEIRFSDIKNINSIDLKSIKKGDVVALIGDFNPASILTLLRLIDLKAIVVPLTTDTKEQHQYFFESALVDYVIENDSISKIEHNDEHKFIKVLRQRDNPGLILFSTGTTGRPKAILHDLSIFLKRFESPRPTLRTLNFLLFDHIGGINTLFHTLFNKGVVIAPTDRNVDAILNTCNKYDVEVLPTTPTFLRMMLISGCIPSKIPSCLKIITYGTERMDQPTLNQLCELLPDVDFRQTFGMSELGIVRVKSENRNSLFMKIGGEGIKTKVKNDVLYINSASRMIGYLNAPQPFDKDNWYNTKDIVETKNELFKIVGREGDVINVGGLKFMSSEVERVALEFPNISLVKAYPKNNPISGQHVEIIAQSVDNTSLDKSEFKKFMKKKLPTHMVPKRYSFEKIDIGHRYKKK